MIERPAMRILLLTLLAAFPAHAACQGETALSCQIGKKVLDVCLSGSDVTYAFGPNGKPELKLSVPTAKADYRPWNGIGRYMGDAMAFENDGITYEVWYSVDRLEDEHRLDAGINIVENGELVAQLTCDQGSIDQRLDIIYSAKEAVGQCWNYETQAWGPPCPTE
jgi:hypothetical protein